MANNPLYPGYIPEDNVNPLYPGYYPGTPSNYRPPDKGYIKGAEFNLDEMTKIIDNVYYTAGLAGPGALGWIRDRVIDDWEQNMKVSIRPQDVKPEDLDDYDMKLEGAFGIKADLNPLEWAKDPSGLAQKTVKSWLSAGANWGDMEIRFRKEAWTQVFKNNIDESGANLKFSGEGIALAALGTALSGWKEGEGYSQRNNPLGLEKRGIYVEDPDMQKARYSLNDLHFKTDDNGDITGAALKRGATPEMGQIDVFKDFTSRLADFESESGYALKRQDKFDKLAFSGYRAATEELSQMVDQDSALYKTVRAAADSGDKTAIDKIQRMEEISRRVKENPELMRALETAKTRVTVMEDMNRIGEALKDTAGGVEKAFVGGKKVKIRDITDTQTKVEELMDHMEQSLGRLGTVDKGEAEFIRRYSDNFKKQVEGILETDTFTRAGEIAGLEAKLKASGLTAAEQSQLDSLYKRMNPRTLYNNLQGTLEGGMLGKPLAGGGPLGNSFQRLMVRDTNQDLYAKGLRGKKTLVDVIEEASTVDNSLGARVVLGATAFTRNTEQVMGSMDIMGAALDGKLMERYLWPRVKTYWRAWTPAQYTKEALGKLNNFGLSELKEGKFEKSVLYGLTTLRKLPDDEPGKVFGNWFSINDVDSTGHYLQMRTYGGSHFKAVSSLAEMLKEKEWTPEAMAYLLEASRGGLSAKDFAPDSAFLRGLLKKMPAGTTLDMIHLPKGMFESPDALNEFIKDVTKFREWADKNKDKIKTNLKPGTAEYYKKLIELLKKRADDPDFKAAAITSKFVGLLERVNVQLNRLQSFVLKKFGKYLAPIAYAKKAAIDLLSSGIAKLIALAAGAATAGAGTALGLAIEKIIRVVVTVVVEKTTEAISVVYKAIAHADYDAVFKYIDKNVQNMAKITLIGCLIFAMLFYAPANFMMKVFSVSFSPVDNTIVGFYGDGDWGEPEGTGLESPPLISIASSVPSCFKFEYIVGANAPDILGGKPTGAWPAEWQGKIDAAIAELMAHSGGYVGRLCEAAGGKIQLLWVPPDAATGFCGAASPSEKRIFFGNNSACYPGSYQPWYWNYLFAHETGHIYDGIIPDEGHGNGDFQEAESAEGVLLTYPNVKRTPENECEVGYTTDESFADTIGDAIRLNTHDCNVGMHLNLAGSPDDINAMYADFWNVHYPRHRDYVKNVLFRP